VDATVRRIADKVRHAREALGLTLQQLAERSGVAPSTIQKVEAGTMVPSVAVMMKIARGLRKKIGFFLDEDDEPARGDVSFLRRHDRVSTRLGGRDISAQSLTSGLADAELNGFVVTLLPAAGSGEEPLHHRGEDLVYCIRGRVAFTVDGRQYTLGRGDCLHFKGELAHAWRNAGRSRAEIVFVSSLPGTIERSVFRSAASSERRAG
jgi:transcriptional regulator with XRE-family HTH domain